MSWLALLLACDPLPPAGGVLVPDEPEDTDVDTDPTDTDVPDTDVPDTDLPADTDLPDTDLPADTDVPEPTGDTGAPCPPDMVAIDGFCIDRYEAHLVGQSPYAVPTAGVAANAAGQVPQGYISGEVASAACQAAGKRLCATTEWRRACQGPAGTTYPYGNTYQSGTCNEGRSVHPVIELFGGAANWSSSQMNDPGLNQLPDSLAASGAYSGCVTAEGVFDMHGNLHEWVADPNGTFLGGFYVDASINGAGCTYTTTAHAFGYHDYSTGFRCCADPL
ncbi:MAG: SUMF1/EgtB/PvdO family nonheme iron enzyme [Alphaproteobacteria bacterium]|nr:SUMF1/EgtB/PvdO family nonheme iron enzyme [Alphaproteobacteria bacterium]